MLQQLAMKFDQWFVPEWRKALKLFSVQFNLATALVFEAVQLSPALPPEVRAIIPEPWGHIIVGVWTLVALLGRLKSQQQVPPSV